MARWMARDGRRYGFYGEDMVLAAYLDTFEEIARAGAAESKMTASDRARNV